MNRKYLWPVLLLSVSVWLVVGGARAGLNLFDDRYLGVFQWADAALTAAFAVVEVIFLPHLARAIFIARKDDSLKPFYRILLAATLFTVFALPVLATPVFAALHTGDNFMERLAASWIFLPWLFISFCVLPVSMVSIGLAEMVHSESKQAGPRNAEQLVTEAVLKLGTIAPQQVAAEAGLSVAEVDQQIGRLSKLFHINGR